jgi:hypothetical protein
VTYIGDNTFKGCHKLTIHCKKGSHAESYAVSNDIKVKIEANLDEDPWDEIVEDNNIDELNEDFIEESL